MTNIEKWINELRTTEHGQANGTLGVDDADGRRTFCCLGLGASMVESIKTTMLQNSGKILYNGHMTFAPPEFTEWLGLKSPDQVSGYPNERGLDVVLDVPEELFHTGTRTRVTASALNDEWRLTFDQIADMIEYFGLLEAEFNE